MTEEQLEKLFNEQVTNMRVFDEYKNDITEKLKQFIFDNIKQAKQEERTRIISEIQKRLDNFQAILNNLDNPVQYIYNLIK